MWTQPCPGRFWAPRCPHGRLPRFPGTLPDIFFLVLLCDRNVSAIGFQFMLKNPPKSIVFHTESVVQHRGDIVLSVKVRTEDGCQTFAAIWQGTEHKRERSRGQTDGIYCLPPQSCRREKTGAVGRHRACGRAGTRVLGGAGGPQLHSQVCS